MKRFTDTAIWEKPWFRRLPPRLKELFRFLCERCDPAGVWEPDWDAAAFYIGEPCQESDLEQFNGNAVMRDGKVLLPQFVEFQYGKLSHECRPHEKVFQAIERHGLKQRELFSDLPPPRKRAVRSAPVTDADFEAFWSAYPLKVGKQDALKAWSKNGRPELPVLLGALERQKKWPQWLKDGGQFIPHASRWLNSKRWEDKDPPMYGKSADAKTGGRSNDPDRCTAGDGSEYTEYGKTL